MRRLIFISSLALIVAFTAPRAFAIDTHVENAILNGNWDEILKTLEKDDAQVNDPVARLLMAHACLATNHNNASMLLFLSVKEENDLKSWSEWTGILLQKNQENPIALYLSADAKGRAGNLNEAIQILTKAIKIKDDFALAYNARGVIRVLSNDWDNALVDFLLATNSAPDLADAHANSGTYYILIEASDGAIEAFNKAIDLNPEFALAYNGLGCAYFGKGEFDTASQYFTTASQLCPTLVVPEINQGFASVYASKLITIAEKLEENPGTTLNSINKQYPDILKQQVQQTLNILPSQKDHKFWEAINSPAGLRSNPENLPSLVKEYGIEKVRMGIFIKMNEGKQKIDENSLTIQKVLVPEITSYNKKIGMLQTVDTVLSLGNAARSMIYTLNKPSLTVPEAAGFGGADTVRRSAGESFKTIAPGAGVTTGKAVAGALAPDGWSTFIKGVPTSLDPISAVVGGARVFVDLEKLDQKIGRQNTLNKMTNLQADNVIHAANTRMYSGLLNDLSSPHSSTNPSKLLNSQIPGYYTSTGRPITEIGAMASMVDKGIKPSGNFPRKALIASQDPFRAGLLQSELNKNGFQTMVIPRGTDPQIAAKQWGADVILGVRESGKMPQIRHTPIIQEPKKLFSDDTYRKTLPFPPDKGGGGAIGIPQTIQPKI